MAGGVRKYVSRSIKLEPKLWQALDDLAQVRGVTRDILLAEIVKGELKRAGVTWWETRQDKVIRRILDEGEGDNKGEVIV